MAKCVTSTDLTEVDELLSTQTEADTRMLLHAMDFDRRLNAKNASGRIVIKSPDTDVMVLLVHYMPQMLAVSEVWMETGRITKTLDVRRMIPIHDIANSVGSATCTILPECHALTGCDTVSSLYGVGKKKMRQLVMKKLVQTLLISKH